MNYESLQEWGHLETPKGEIWSPEKIMVTSSILPGKSPGGDLSNSSVEVVFLP